MSSDDAPRATTTSGKRHRSARYPGRTLSEAIELARKLVDQGLDGLSAPALASALGYSNIKTNTFSSLLSSARQFGLIDLRDDCYHLTALGRAIPYPVDSAHAAMLHREALLQPGLYAELASRFADRKLPELEVIANLLYNHHQITAAAKRTAAEVFLESARFAQTIDPDGVFRPRPHAPSAASTGASAGASAGAGNTAAAGGAIKPAAPRAPLEDASTAVRLDLPLWGADQGKTIRLRAPETISRQSYERFLETFARLVRVREED
jgi:hypothetical protein